MIQDAVYEIWPTFDDFWDLYEKKRGRPNAIKWWEKLTQEEREDCMAAIPAYIRANPDKTFRKDPERYLRHKAFYDEVIERTEKGRPTTDQYTTGAAEALKQRLDDRRAQAGGYPAGDGVPHDTAGS